MQNKACSGFVLRYHNARSLSHINDRSSRVNENLMRRHSHFSPLASHPFCEKAGNVATLASHPTEISFLSIVSNVRSLCFRRSRTPPSPPGWRRPTVARGLPLSRTPPPMDKPAVKRILPGTTNAWRWPSSTRLQTAAGYRTSSPRARSTAWPRTSRSSRTWRSPSKSSYLFWSPASAWWEPDWSLIWFKYDRLTLFRVKYFMRNTIDRFRGNVDAGHGEWFSGTRQLIIFFDKMDAFVQRRALTADST